MTKTSVRDPTQVTGIRLRTQIGVNVLEREDPLGSFQRVSRSLPPDSCRSGLFILALTYGVMDHAIARQAVFLGFLPAVSPHAARGGISCDGSAGNTSV